MIDHVQALKVFFRRIGRHHEDITVGIAMSGDRFYIESTNCKGIKKKK